MTLVRLRTSQIQIHLITARKRLRAREIEFLPGKRAKKGKKMRCFCATESAREAMRLIVPIQHERRVSSVKCRESFDAEATVCRIFLKTMKAFFFFRKMILFLCPWCVWENGYQIESQWESVIVEKLKHFNGALTHTKRVRFRNKTSPNLRKTRA